MSTHRQTETHHPIYSSLIVVSFSDLDLFLMISIRDNYHDSLWPDCFGKSLDLAISHPISPGWRPFPCLTPWKSCRSFWRKPIFLCHMWKLKTPIFDIQMPFQTEYCVFFWGGRGGIQTKQSLSNWWFQPLWKNISENGNLPQVGMKI